MKAFNQDQIHRKTTILKNVRKLRPFMFQTTALKYYFLS